MCVRSLIGNTHAQNELRLLQNRKLKKKEIKNLKTFFFRTNQIMDSPNQIFIVYLEQLKDQGPCEG